jgi:alkaline phosphatase D
LFALQLIAFRVSAAEPRQANGVKVGEVSDTSAIVWMRLTAKSSRNTTGILRKGPIMLAPPQGTNPDEFEGACPGAAGQARLRCGTREDLTDATETTWVDVTAKTDFTHQFRLSGLKPATVYHYAAETAGPGGAPKHVPLRGRFETAPPAKIFADVTFTAITCRAYKDIDHKDGFHHVGGRRYAGACRTCGSSDSGPSLP